MYLLQSTVGVADLFHFSGLLQVATIVVGDDVFVLDISAFSLSILHALASVAALRPIAHPDVILQNFFRHRELVSDLWRIQIFHRQNLKHRCGINKTDL